MNKKLVDLIKKEFEKLISAKNNSWGKNELLRAHDQAIAAATLRLLDGE